MSTVALTLPEDRAFKAFLSHPSEGTAGQLLAAIHAYRDALVELGYMPRDIYGMAADPFVDAAERAALAAAPSPPVSVEQAGKATAAMVRAARNVLMQHIPVLGSAKEGAIEAALNAALSVSPPQGEGSQ